MDQSKKKQIKKIATWVSLAALVAGLAAMPLLAKAEAAADGPVATVHYGVVEEGTVCTSLHGGGTLLTEDTETIKLPSGVKIREFLVKNGEFVTAGTPLAAVDQVSVMSAIVSVTETMEYLQDQIKGAKDDQIDSTISATAGGRVKQVFARKGDSVQDVMLEHGALALLSLDGLMAVKIEEKLDIPTGDSVTVTMADGKETAGRVASNLDGVIVITLEDDGYAIGQTVAVTKDGSKVGSGELYIHNAWSAVAFSGTIQTVYAREESKVNSGASLFTLTDTDFQGTMDYMASLHREYEELLQELFLMYRSGTIDAPCDGTVSGIDKDSPYLLAAEEDEIPEAALLTVEQPHWQVVLLSNAAAVADDNCDPSAGENCPATVHRSDCLKACQNGSSCSATGQHYPECIGSCTGGAVCGAKYHRLACIESCIPTDGTCSKDAKDGYHKAACIKSCLHGSTLEECLKDATYPHYQDCIKSCTASNGTTDCPATKHLPGCIESCTHAKTKDQCIADPYHYPDCIHACTGGEDCPATRHNDTCYFAGMTYLAKVALVDQVGTSELLVRWDSSGKQYEVVKNARGWTFKNPSDFNPALLVNSGKISVSNAGAYKAGDVILVIKGYRGSSTEPVWSTMAVYTNLGSSGGGMQMGDLSSLLAGLGGLRGFGGLGGFNFSVETPTAGQQLFDLKGSTLMTVSPNETVSLTITLDEQDIAKVSVGQKATVRVEALGKDTFEAVVTEIGNHGVNGGGSSKFTAKLELPKEKNMLDGMSATAALPLQEKAAVPTIPVMALTEMGPRTVVYTALDEEGNPCTPVSVTIGLSDGITAEILEGLAPGDSYYYSYYDVLEVDTGVENRYTLR